MNAESIAKLQAGTIGNLDVLYQEHGFPAVKDVIAHFLADKMDYLDTETVRNFVDEMFSDVALDNQKTAEALEAGHIKVTD